MILKALLFAALLVSAADAPAQKAKAQPGEGKISVEIRVTYYECSAPETCNCVAANQEEKDQCSECTKWRKAHFPSIARVIDATASYGKDELFLADAARMVYQRGIHTGQGGGAIPVADFYKNYKSYGWVEVDKDLAGAGAFALWPDKGGILVGGGATPMGMEEPQILYCSPGPKKGCSLTRMEPSDVDAAGEPRYVIPKELLDLIEKEAPEEKME